MMLCRKKYFRSIELQIITFGLNSPIFQIGSTPYNTQNLASCSPIAIIIILGIFIAIKQTSIHKNTLPVGT